MKLGGILARALTPERRKQIDQQLLDYARKVLTIVDERYLSPEQRAKLADYRQRYGEAGASPPGGVVEQTKKINGHLPRCQGTTKSGEPCRSFAVPGGDFCVMHDPERVEAMQAARAEGGAKAMQLRALRNKRAKLDDLPALVKFTGEVIHDALDATLPVDVARCVLYGIGIQKSLLEASDLEKRVQLLEEHLALMPKGGR